MLRPSQAYIVVSDETGPRTPTAALTLVCGTNPYTISNLDSPSCRRTSKFTRSTHCISSGIYVQARHSMLKMRVGVIPVTDVYTPQLSHRGRSFDVYRLSQYAKTVLASIPAGAHER